MKEKNLFIEEQNEKIENGLNCGLTFTGEFEEDRPQFIGTNLQWKKYDDGEF
jgi:hypothetical protein